MCVQAEGRRRGEARAVGVRGAGERGALRAERKAARTEQGEGESDRQSTEQTDRLTE